MASLAQIHVMCPASAAAAGGSSSSAFFPITTQFSVNKRRSKRAGSYKFAVSCNASKDDSAPARLDRRNMLIGLGGLYGAAGLVGSGPFAKAAPLQAPLIEECDPADLPPGVDPVDCCPPKPSTKAIDFVPPPKSAPIRIRPAAHLLTDEYIKKYEKAIRLMKALPADDPRNFYQQANVHCAYCNGAHQQVGLPDADFQVHESWLFLPFHRWYLYFFERIAGKMLNDPNFAMPYWNWDSPAGSNMPPMYTNLNSPLYDAIRNPAHYAPRVIDLVFDGVESTATDEEQHRYNMSLMYKQMITNAKTKDLFFGSAYRAGDKKSPGAGSIELQPHGGVHAWCCDPKSPNHEDMGHFYSAGRDPIFYAHHSNIDRMWVLWKQLGGKKRVDISDPDFLNATFHFYDENAQLVRVRVGDCLDNKKLKFEYQKVPVPWTKAKPKPARKQKKARSSDGVANAAEPPKKSDSFFTDVSELPKSLENAIRSQIRRPKISRSQREKEDEEEILVVDLEVDQSQFIKFDVFINDEDDPISRPDNTELAGSFVNIPRKMEGHQHGGDGSVRARTCLKLGLTDLLDDLDADDDETVVVTLVPRTGSDTVRVEGIRIELAE
uniref:Tyrosinase copper-binding domain-containing protein n=1 Tax=Kalanchoe fedtschenkoi TaxID=63787 RepID=A0A7N0RG09_KALFE